MCRTLAIVALLGGGCKQVFGLHQAHEQVRDGGILDATVDASGDGPAPIDAPFDAGGALMVSYVDLAPGDVSLTNEGTIDWAHWGYGAGFDHKTGGNQISDVTATGSRAGITLVAVTASWTDGTPDTAVTATGTGAGAVGTGSALSFTAPAGVAPHTLSVYVGCKDATGRLSVTLSDGSAAAYVDDHCQATGTTAIHPKYTIVFQAASAGQTVLVEWKDELDAGGGFAVLMSATLH